MKKGSMIMSLGIPDTGIGIYFHRMRSEKDEELRMSQLLKALSRATWVVIDPVVGIVMLELFKGQWLIWMSNAACIAMYGGGRQGAFYSFDEEELPAAQSNLQKLLFWDLICRWTVTLPEDLPASFIKQLRVSKPQLEVFLKQPLSK